METSMTQTQSADVAQKQEAAKLPLVAGPMIWYLLAGASILLALYVIFFAPAHSEVERYGIALFIGLWAPMFGIMGLRAELMEMREDMAARNNRRRSLFPGV
jgi:hypothetical protein